MSKNVGVGILAVYLIIAAILALGWFVAYDFASGVPGLSQKEIHLIGYLSGIIVCGIVAALASAVVHLKNDFKDS